MFKNKGVRFFIVYVSIISVFFFIAYAFSIYKEFQLYNKALKNNNLEDALFYITSYPNGNYSSIINMRIENVLWQKIIVDSSSANITKYFKYCHQGVHTENVFFIDLYKSNELDKINRFLTKYPKSKFTKLVLIKKELVWEGLIDKHNKNYIQKNSSYYFFNDLLLYMKSKDINNLYLDFSCIKILNEYLDYSKNTKDSIRNYYDFKNHILFPFPPFGYQPPNDSNVSALSKYFSDKNIEGLENDIVMELSKSIDSVFGENNIFIHQLYNYEYSKLKDYIIMHINYKIKNQLGVYQLPVLWVWSSSYNNEGSFFRGFLQGIQIELSLKIRNPQNMKIKLYENVFIPNNKINNAEDCQESYNIMTRGLISDMRSSILIELGIKDSSLIKK